MNFETRNFGANLNLAVYANELVQNGHLKNLDDLAKTTFYIVTFYSFANFLLPKLEREVSFCVN